jgi:hypothetical protein
MRDRPDSQVFQMGISAGPESLLDERLLHSAAIAFPTARSSRFQTDFSRCRLLDDLIAPPSYGCSEPERNRVPIKFLLAVAVPMGQRIALPLQDAGPRPLGVVPGSTASSWSGPVFNRCRWGLLTAHRETYRSLTDHRQCPISADRHQCHVPTPTREDDRNPQ